MNMKDIFPEYFKDIEEVEKIWKDCVFVFDANVIIDLYRYSESTKESLLKSLRHFKERAWMPRQASEEYLRNRASVIASEETHYTAASNQVNEFLSSLKSLLEKRRQHPFISEKSSEEFFNAAEKMKKELSENGKKHFSRVSDDEIRKEIVDIFDGRVGEGFDEEELYNIFKEGATRYKNKIPPGYEDVDKFKGDVNEEGVSIDDKKRVYGDFIIWKEIIQKSISDRKNIILITGDDKPDWWSVSKGKTLGPRVELIKEFEKNTGYKFYMYTAYSFLSISSKEIEGASDQAAVEEIKEVHSSFLVDHKEKNKKTESINKTFPKFINEYNENGERFYNSYINSLDCENHDNDYNYFKSRLFVVKGEIRGLKDKINAHEVKIERNKLRLMELYGDLDVSDNQKIAATLENNIDHLKKGLDLLKREIATKKVEEEYILFGRES